MKSSKAVAAGEKSRGKTSGSRGGGGGGRGHHQNLNQLHTLHQRLCHALNLGTRFHDGNEWKWKCTNIETQRHVLRAMASFLDCVSAESSPSHLPPLAKDSVADLVGALTWILQQRSDAVLSVAANVAVKLIRVIPNSMLHSCLSELIRPLLSLLSCHQFEVSISCATALNLIFSTSSVIRERWVLEVLAETETVPCIVSGIRQLSGDALSVEYFLEMASLLSTILHWWPPCRYCVWNDAKFMGVLGVFREKPDFSVKVAVLKLYSSLALCGHGAHELLADGEALVQMIVLCMGKSYPVSVRIEGFRLAQRLATSKERCLKVMSLCCEPMVGAIVDAMRGWTLSSGKIATDRMALLVEACRLAFVSRWAGQHHDYFWKQGVEMVLLSLLLENFHNRENCHFLSLEEQISEAQQGLRANFLLMLRPDVWEILGWLAIHCREDIELYISGRKSHIDLLIACACLSFAESVQKGCSISQDGFGNMSRSESATRAVFMMVYSPCAYIASKAKFLLFEILKPTGMEYLKRLMQKLDVAVRSTDFGVSMTLQTALILMALTCYSSLPQYQGYIVKFGGLKTLTDFVKCCLQNSIVVGRLSLSPHRHNMMSDRTCCWVKEEDWEGDDILLFYGLWGIAELIHSGLVRNKAEIFAGLVDNKESQLVSMLQQICCDSFSPGLKWIASFILSYFGLYGFPCEWAKHIGKSLNDTEYADVQLVLTNGDFMTVHGIILATRCPSLLPPKELLANAKGSDPLRKFQREIRLSSHVDKQALAKLLEYVYLGYLSAGEELVKKLKILARHCDLQSLLLILGRQHPNWGTPFPSYDLTVALTPAGHLFSDVVLEAKANESICWTCNVCSLLVPHVHAHKVVLWSSCDYLRALFQSGMQESYSQIVRIPISWEAMTKLVSWFYTYELPSPPSGCLWQNKDTEEKLHVLQPYIELFSLAEFWFLEDVSDICYKFIIPCLNSAPYLCIKVMRIAAGFSLWKLAKATANCLAPFYRQLCHSGDLEALDEELVDMIRAASVQLSQET